MLLPQAHTAVAAYGHRVPNGQSRSCKIIDFGTNRKHVCNFLLVINSNLGHILPRFTDISRFSVENSDLATIPPEFCGCSIRLDYRCWDTRSKDPKLINRVIIFELIDSQRVAISSDGHQLLLK